MRSNARGRLRCAALTLDAAGTATVMIDKLPPIDRPASLLVEMEYSDPERRAAGGRNARCAASGRPVSGHQAGRLGGKQETRARADRRARLRSASRSPDVRVKRRCLRTQDLLEPPAPASAASTPTTRPPKPNASAPAARARPMRAVLLFCTVKPRRIGRADPARARQRRRRHARLMPARACGCAAASDWWFEPTNHDRIDLIPEKKRYEPGETREVPGAHAVSRGDRAGHRRARRRARAEVVELDGKSPVIEVPVAGSYGPNVFVSALAVRGRVDPEVPGPYAWLKRWFYRVGYWLGFVDDVPVRARYAPDRARRSRQTRLQARHGGDQSRAARLRAQSESDARARRAQVRETARVAVEVTDADGQAGRERRDRARRRRRRSARAHGQRVVEHARRAAWASGRWK